MRKIITSLITFAYIGIGLNAQVSFTASANKVVEMGENFRLNFTVNANGSGFKPPALGDFRVLAGPSTQTSSSFQYINGKTTQTISNTFSYVIQAQKVGKFTIGSAEITVDGKTYKTNPITVEVLKGGTGHVNTDNNNNIDQSNVKSNTDVFLRLNMNKTTVYQGEQLVASVKIYDKNRSLADISNFKLPSFTGFWSQEIEMPSNITLERENVNGQIYYTSVLKQNILFPQKSGNLSIDPFELECIVREVAGQRRNFFGELINVYRDVTKTIKSPRRTIKVLPLPPNKPASFTGAVGSDFRFNVDVDRTELKSNESITLKVTVTGKGNLQVIDKINFNFPASFEIFDPKVSSNISNTRSGSKGTKTYEYLIIPREPGKYNIPGVEFSYFDVASKSYKTLSAKEINFNIEKGEDNQVFVSDPSLSKEEVEAIGSDIRFIVQDGIVLHKGDYTFFGTITFYLFYIISLVLFIAIIVILRKRIKQNQNIVLQKNKRANRISKKRLKEAANYMKQGNKEAFYDEVIRALWGYLSDKLNIPVADLSRETVIETLTKRNIEPEIINNFVEVIDNCEFAKYAPASTHDQIEQDYDKARKTINKLVHALS